MFSGQVEQAHSQFKIGKVGKRTKSQQTSDFVPLEDQCQNDVRICATSAGFDRLNKK